MSTLIRVENIMKEANGIQLLTKQLTEEQKALEEELRSSSEEEERARRLLEAVETELQELQTEVQKALLEKEYHRCSAEDADMEALHQLGLETSRRGFMLKEKEKHVQGILEEAQKEMQRIEDLQTNQVDAQSSIVMLRGLVEQQEIEIATLTALHEEELHLLEDFSTNEKSIDEMRKELELLGVDIPIAPVQHRMNRVMRERKRLEVSSSAAVALTRVIELPVGVLNIITSKLGPLQSLTKSCGVDSFSIELQEDRTFIHCRGTNSSIDVLESKIRSTLDYALSGSYLTSGLITYSSLGGTGEACKATADKIAKLLEG
jgi:DNA repair exonuclease SbcCD ATPase subunit